MAKTFGVQDALAALGITTTYFEIQDYNPDLQADIAEVKTRLGARVAAAEKAYNERTEYALTLKAKDPDGQTLVLTLGGTGTAGLVLTRAVVRQVNTDYATVQLTGHLHSGANAATGHLAAPLSQEITTPSLGFGVIAVQLGGTLADCQSSELTYSVEHTDMPNNAGAFLVGASHGLLIEGTEEYVDDGSPITIASPFTQLSQATREGNTGLVSRIIRGRKVAA